MKWTKDEPSVSGYYLYRMTSAAAIEITRVTVRGDKYITFFGNQNYYKFDELSNGEFLGPVNIEDLQ